VRHRKLFDNIYLVSEIRRFSAEMMRWGLGFILFVYDFFLSSSFPLPFFFISSILFSSFLFSSFLSIFLPFFQFFFLSFNFSFFLSLFIFFFFRGRRRFFGKFPPYLSGQFWRIYWYFKNTIRQWFLKCKI